MISGRKPLKNTLKKGTWQKADIRNRLLHAPPHKKRYATQQKYLSAIFPLNYTQRSLMGRLTQLHMGKPII